MGKLGGEGIYGACSRRDAASPAPSQRSGGRQLCSTGGWLRGNGRIDRFPSGLARHCFKIHPVQERGAAQFTKQAKFASPQAARACSGQPNTPLVPHQPCTSVCHPVGLARSVDIFEWNRATLDLVIAYFEACTHFRPANLAYGWISMCLEGTVKLIITDVRLPHIT